MKQVQGLEEFTHRLPISVDEKGTTYRSWEDNENMFTTRNRNRSGEERGVSLSGAKSVSSLPFFEALCFTKK